MKLLFGLAIALLSVVGAAYGAADLKLERLNVIPESLTLSGFSSGAGITQELFVSYPSLFKGIAIFQQTFYRCGNGTTDVALFDKRCTSLSNETEPSDPQDAVNDINRYFQQGLIEDPRLMENKKFYVYAGLRNFIFKPEMMLNVLKVFEPFIKNPYAIRTRVQDSGYLFPTASFGHPCNESADKNYWLGNCQLNGPYDALSFLYGEDRIQLPTQNDQANLESLQKFDQSEFFANIKDRHFLANSGYLYVPKKCAQQQGNSPSQQCFIHIYFHGCGTGADFNDGKHIIHSGYLELAEKNNIVMLFPQIQKDEVNFLGCWDSFGNTGPLYATQKGVQVDFIYRILQRILPPPRQRNTGIRHTSGMNFGTSISFLTVTVITIYGHL